MWSLVWGFTVAVAALAAVAWHRWRATRRYWAERGVPHEPPHPLLGSLTFLQKENPGEWMRRLAARLPAPYVGIWLFWRPAVVINSPEMARRVLVKDAHNFRDHFLTAGRSDPIGHYNIFMAKDPLWSAVRRKLGAVLTPARLRAMQPLHIHKARQLTERLRDDARADRPIDLRNVYSDYTTDLIGVVSFSTDEEATLTGDSAVRRVTRAFQEYSVWRGLGWAAIFFFPELVDYFRFTMFPKRTTDKFRQIYAAALSARGGYYPTAPAPPPTAPPADLLDVLRRMKLEDDYPEDLLLAQAAIMVQGGFDTSASALTFVTYELAHNPHIQEKLYGELMEAKEKLAGADLDMATLASLTYLDCVIKETLRKYPAMGWLDRVCARDYPLDERVTLRAGTPLYVNAIGMHYNPEYFPEPQAFRPERFLPDQPDIKPFTYMPFGEGPRVCLGMRVAQNSLRFGLSAVVLAYRVRPAPGATPPHELRAEPRGMFFTPGELLAVHFDSRQ